MLDLRIETVLAAVRLVGDHDHIAPICEHFQPALRFSVQDSRAFFRSFTPVFFRLTTLRICI
jgi:hypothetical protein